MACFRTLCLLAGGRRAAAAALGVPWETFRRWGYRTPPPLPALRLLAVLGGYVPWSGWEGFEVVGGRLWVPGYAAFSVDPEDLFRLPYLRQLAGLRGPSGALAGDCKRRAGVDGISKTCAA